VIPFGANIENPPSKEDILEIRKKKPKICRLLFVGVDWERKGGQIAYETMVELNKRGIETELDIVGCTPPPGILHGKMLLHGFLNKNNRGDSQQLDALYKKATFFILPTKSECSGIVNAEAMAYGLPILICKTGGVETYVKDGVIGYLFPTEVKPSVICSSIERLLNNKDEYYQLCCNAVDLYANEFSLDCWIKKVMKVFLEEHI